MLAWQFYAFHKWCTHVADGRGLHWLNIETCNHFSSKSFCILLFLTFSRKYKKSFQFRCRASTGTDCNICLYLAKTNCSLSSRVHLLLFVFIIFVFVWYLYFYLCNISLFFGKQKQIVPSFQPSTPAETRSCVFVFLYLCISVFVFVFVNLYFHLAKTNCPLFPAEHTCWNQKLELGHGAEI